TGHQTDDNKISVIDVNGDNEDQLGIRGYKVSRVFQTISWVGIVSTLGALRLLFYWYPRLHLYATHKPCSFDEADSLLLAERNDKRVIGYHVKRMKILNPLTLSEAEKLAEGKVNSQQRRSKIEFHVSGGNFKSLESVKVFDFKKQRYVWNPECLTFDRLRGLDYEMPVSLLTKKDGLSMQERNARRGIYGPNEITIPESSITALLFKEIINPFYVFEIFSLFLWALEEYYLFSLTIFTLSLASVVAAVYQARKTQTTLRNLVESPTFVEVHTDGKRETLPTQLLVPGDLLTLPPAGCILMCDAVLIHGTCIVDESTLTGESVPVTKTAIWREGAVVGEDIYDERVDSGSTLYCGTKVVQSRKNGREGEVLAVCIRTGFATTKGAVVRAVLYPPPLDFKFEKDSYKFVACLAAVASIAFVYTVYDKLRKHTLIHAIFYGLDLITIVVPPALPAAMTVGSMHAQARLKRRSAVFCLSPRAINVAGGIDCVCFDKTGTLTEDTLDLWGVVPIENGQICQPTRDPSTVPCDSHLSAALASCHSLTIVKGELVGDPLDLKMFRSNDWILEEPQMDNESQFDPPFTSVLRPRRQAELRTTVGVVKQLPFSSDLSRMSVVCQNLTDGKFTVYCKGAPEIIFSLCQPQLVPRDCEVTLQHYTQKGYRVIAIAYRELEAPWFEIKTTKREDLEWNLNPLGLIVFENPLKPGCSEVMRELHNANIRTIMVTGDNLQTALSVARNCEMIQADKSIQEIRISSLACAHSPLTFTSVTGIDINPVNFNEKIVENLRIEGEEKSTGTDRMCVALTGETWSYIKINAPELVSNILNQGIVFARMSPGQKQQLVQDLQAQGFCVGMVGDGANDCGALGAANAGISLSDAEASAASAFTARTRGVHAVLAVLKEGRAALTTSFGLFKYMAAYSLTEFTSVMLLYSQDSNFSDLQYLYIDLGLITVFAYLLSHGPPSYGALVKNAPETSLLSRGPLLSLLVQLGIMGVFQMAAFYAVPHSRNYGIFVISSVQYVLLAFVFFHGPPHRAPMSQDWLFIGTTILALLFMLYLMFFPADVIEKLFDLKSPDKVKDRLLVLFLILANIFSAIVIEQILRIYATLPRWTDWHLLAQRFYRICQSHR
ncbi:unnamed protein product, partial [Bemisia tabaci]